jgi:hypothetical protein
LREKLGPYFRLELHAEEGTDKTALYRVTSCLETGGSAIFSDPMREVMSVANKMNDQLRLHRHVDALLAEAARMTWTDFLGCNPFGHESRIMDEAHYVAANERLEAVRSRSQEPDAIESASVRAEREYLDDHLECATEVILNDLRVSDSIPRHERIRAMVRSMSRRSKEAFVDVFSGVERSVRGELYRSLISAFVPESFNHPSAQNFLGAASADKQQHQQSPKALSCIEMLGDRTFIESHADRMKLRWRPEDELEALRERDANRRAFSVEVLEHAMVSDRYALAGRILATGDVSAKLHPESWSSITYLAVRGKRGGEDRALLEPILRYAQGQGVTIDIESAFQGALGLPDSEMLCKLLFEHSHRDERWVKWIEYAVSRDDSGAVRALANAIGKEKLVRMKLHNIPILSLAVHRGSDAVLKSLCELGADVNFDDGGDTALTFAINNNRTNMVATLLEAGSNLDFVNRDGKTPIQMAQSFGLAEIESMIRSHQVKSMIGDLIKSTQIPARVEAGAYRSP